MIRTAVLSVLGLAKNIGSRKILDRVSFTLNAGELLAITGPNGAGKTTLLRLLAGVSRPTAGEAKLRGRTIEPSQPHLRHDIGYVGHESLVYNDLTGCENLDFFASAYGVDNQAPRIRRTLEWWDLAHVGNQAVRTYSRGMRQRLALGRAALHDPVLLLLDEPSAGLDAPGQQKLAEFLDVHRQKGGAVVLTTHDAHEAQRLNGFSASISGGRLVIHS